VTGYVSPRKCFCIGSFPHVHPLRRPSTCPSINIPTVSNSVNKVVASHLQPPGRGRRHKDPGKTHISPQIHFRTGVVLKSCAFLIHPTTPNYPFSPTGTSMRWTGEGTRQSLVTQSHKRPQ